MKYNISNKLLQNKKADKNTNSQSNIVKFKTVNESYTNDNIYKNDIYYKINKDLSFDIAQEEQNCRRNIFHRYCNAVIPLIAYQLMSSLHHLIFSMHELSWITIILYLPSIAMLLFALFLVNNFDKLDKNSGIIRYFLEAANLMDIIVVTSSEHNKNFTVPIKFCYSIIYNSVFGLNINESLLFYGTEFVTILACIGNFDCIIYTRIFYNLFSKKGIQILMIICSVIAIQYFFSKSVREIWALYDSFKRSYFNLKHCYDEIPFPVLVISKKSPNTIYYKNPEADTLFQRRKQTRQSDRLITNSRMRKLT
jgi:hypothetical protein